MPDDDHQSERTDGTTEEATETDDAADPDLEAVTEAAGGAIETDLAIDPDPGVATDTADETDTKHITTATHTESTLRTVLSKPRKLTTNTRFLSTTSPEQPVLLSPTALYLLSLYIFSFTLSRTETKT